MDGPRALKAGHRDVIETRPSAGFRLDVLLASFRGARLLISGNTGDNDASSSCPQKYGRRRHPWYPGGQRSTFTTLSPTLVRSPREVCSLLDAVVISSATYFQK